MQRLLARGQALLPLPQGSLPALHGQSKRPSGLYLEECLRLALPSDCGDPAQVLAFVKKAGSWWSRGDWALTWSS